MPTSLAREEERFYILSAIREWRSDYEFYRGRGDLLMALACYRKWGRHIRALKNHERLAPPK